VAFNPLVIDIAIFGGWCVRLLTRQVTLLERMLPTPSLASPSEKHRTAYLNISYAYSLCINQICKADLLFALEASNPVVVLVIIAIIMQLEKCKYPQHKKIIFMTHIV
jgi:hypothetical protein